MTGNGSKPTEMARHQVLVVEDDPMIRRLIVDVLTSRNEAECTEAATVSEAIERLDEGPYEAVVLDVLLRGGGAKKVYAHLDEGGDSLAKRIVFVTGLIETPEVEKICEITGNILLRKPFYLDDLAGAVKTVLARK